MSTEIALAKQGDREALNRLLRRHHERLNQQASLWLGADARARVRTSDLVQATYLDVVSGIRGFEGETEEAFVAWILQALRRNLSDRIRHQKAMKRAVDREVRWTDAQGRPAQGMSPSKELAFSEELVMVHEALLRLEPEHREVIERKVLRGEPHEEVAKAMNRSEQATRSLLTRARASLLIEFTKLHSERSNNPEA